MAEAMETQAPYLPCFAACDPVFSAEECRKILAIGQARPARAGVMQSTAGSGQPVYERGPDRDSAVTLLEPGPETEWIYQRLFAVAKDANSHNWRFELARSERLLFTSHDKKKSSDP